jgi:hypothetical protein
MVQVTFSDTKREYQEAATIRMSSTTPAEQQEEKLDAAAAVAEVGTSNNVYIASAEHAWVPARVVDIDSNKGTANVSIPLYKEEQLIQSDGGKKAVKFDRRSIQLKDYVNKALPLQNVDENGILNEVQDMVDLPFLHEVRLVQPGCLLWNMLHPSNSSCL